MFEILRLRARLGSPAIAKLLKARPPRGYVGLPALAGGRCAACTAASAAGGAASEGRLAACAAACPTGAIAPGEPRVDLGRCTFCGDCARACVAACKTGGDGAIRFTGFHRLAATSREALVVGPGAEEDYEERAIAARRDLRSLLGRSLKLRQVSAGGCNACEMELNAASNVNFDMGRLGIEWVASPRHADGLVLTGPLSANMADALQDAWDAMPEPKILILAGACAISGGVFASSPSLDRGFLDRVRPDLYVPGCPPHPLTFIHGILSLLGKGERRRGGRDQAGAR